MQKYKKFITHLRFLNMRLLYLFTALLLSLTLDDLHFHKLLGIAYAGNTPGPQEEPKVGARLPMASNLQSHGLTQEQLDKLAQTMLHSVETKQVAGCSLLVADKGEIVFRKAVGFADIETKRLFSTDDLLPIASVTKPFMASLIMTLVEQGKLNLDDPVEKYLPKFKEKKVEGHSSNTRPMTIRQLIAHTAGFWSNTKKSPEKRDLIRNPERTLAESVDLISTYDLIYEPGTKWVYSGAGYCVLGRVVEVVLNQSLDQVAQDTLFRPLGLIHTTFLPSKEVRKTVPSQYLIKNLTLQKLPPIADVENIRFILPGGSLFSTLDEIAVFGQMHMNDGLFDGKRILSEESVAKMRRLQSPDRPKSTYGLGWFRDDITEDGLAELTYHGGSLGALFRVDRSREMVFVFLAHQDGRSLSKLKNILKEQVNGMFPIPLDR